MIQLYLFKISKELFLIPHHVIIASIFSLIKSTNLFIQVNGWEEHYGEKSFLFQCKKRFGRVIGEKIWEVKSLNLVLFLIVKSYFVLNFILRYPIFFESINHILFWNITYLHFSIAWFWQVEFYHLYINILNFCYISF